MVLRYYSISVFNVSAHLRKPSLPGTRRYKTFYSSVVFLFIPALPSLYSLVFVYLQVLAVYVPYALLTVGLRWVIYLGVGVFNITDDDITYKFLWKPFDEPPATSVVTFVSAITDTIKVISTVLAQLLALIFPSTSMCFTWGSKNLIARNTVIPVQDTVSDLVVQKLSNDSNYVDGDPDHDSQFAPQRYSNIDNSINIIDGSSQLIVQRHSIISISSSISSSVSSRISSNDDEDEDTQLALPRQPSISISSSVSSNDDEDEGMQLALPRQPSIENRLAAWELMHKPENVTYSLTA